MSNFKRGLVAIACGALLAVGLPSLPNLAAAQAENAVPQPVNAPISLATAKSLLNTIESNDDVQGPMIDAAKECAYIALPQTDREKVKNAINAVRAFNNVAPVALLGEDNAAWHDTQEAAISMANQDYIDHSLKAGSDKFKCYTDNGVKAVKNALLSLSRKGYLDDPKSVTGAAHVRILINDQGDSGLGHRVDLLTPKLQNTAFGAAKRAFPDGSSRWSTKHVSSAFDVLSMQQAGAYDTDNIINRAATGPATIAWPSAGFFPYSLLPAAKGLDKSTDRDNWSFQVYGQEQNTLDDATVTVTGPDGVAIKPTVSHAPKTGNGAAIISFHMPDLAKPADNTFSKYNVLVVAGAKSWTYDVKVFNKLDVDPDAPAVNITTQPTDQTISEGEDATFTVVAKAKNSQAALTYQWQKKAADAQQFTSIEGANQASYTVAKPAIGKNTKYRVIISLTGATSVTSDEVNLTVTEKPSIKITTQPADQTITEGSDATFSVVAEAQNSDQALTYQWQSKAKDAAEFSNIADATKASYTVSKPAVGEGTKYRVVVSLQGAKSVTSEEASLTVKPKDVELGEVKIDVPEEFTINEGQDLSLTVKSTPAVDPENENAPQVTWQYSKDGEAYTDLTADQLAEGSKLNAATIKVKIADHAKWQGVNFRAVVKHGEKSKEATTGALQVQYAPELAPLPDKLSDLIESGKGTEQEPWVFYIQQGKGLKIDLTFKSIPAADKDGFVWSVWKDNKWVEVSVDNEAVSHADRSRSGVEPVAVTSPLLTIRAKDVQEGAMYKLSAKNKIGETSVYFKLTKKQLNKDNSSDAGSDNAKPNKPAILPKTGFGGALTVLPIVALLSGAVLFVGTRRRKH